MIAKTLVMADSVAMCVEDNVGTDLAESWEQGCEKDPVRNDLIVPALVKIFSRWRPASIMDLGSGTGFIARAVDGRLAYRPYWLLVDNDPARISLSEDNCPPQMNVTHLNCNILSIADYPFQEKYSALILCFTLLEFSDSFGVLSVLGRLMSPNGLVIIVLPDPWQDLLSIERDTGIRALTERVLLPKVDKFTKLPYPFFISRNELLISMMLKLGFRLNSIERYGQKSAVYITTFQLVSEYAND